MSHTGVISSAYPTSRRRDGQSEALDSALAALASGGPTPRLRFLCLGDAAREPAAVVVWPDGAPLLAELVAMFANLGLRVAGHEQLPHPGQQVPPCASAHRFDFCALDVMWTAQTPALVAEAFEAAAVGRMEVDGFTKLVATAALPWHETVLIRAACRYVRQVGLELSESNVVAILLVQQVFVRAFIGLFHARFAPDLVDRETAVAAAEAALGRCVEDTCTLDEDRLLRSLWSFISALLRTNWFQWDHRGDADGRPTAFKIDPSRLWLTSAVVPYREIFVHAPIVEGSHVRGGKVVHRPSSTTTRSGDSSTAPTSNSTPTSKHLRARAATRPISYSQPEAVRGTSDEY